MLLGRCRAGDLARLDAGGAHVQALGRPGDDGPNGLNVRVPTTAGTNMRVRHVVAEARPLAANVADGSHGCLQNWLDSESDERPNGRHESRRRLRQLTEHTGTRPRPANRAAVIPRGSDPPYPPNVGGRFYAGLVTTLRD